MTLIRDYPAYIEALRSWDGQGERPAHEIDALLAAFSGDFAKGGCNYLLYGAPSGKIKLLRIEKNDNGLQITGCVDVDQEQMKNLADDVSDLGCSQWLDLCFYRQEDDQVVYDEYYDGLLAAKGTSVKVGDIKLRAEEIADALSIKAGDNLAIHANLFLFNPLVYALEKKGINVKMIRSDWMESFNICTPGYQASISGETFFAPFAVEFGKTYCITVFPETLDSIEFVPNFSLREILPDAPMTYRGSNGLAETLYLARFEGDCFGNELIIVKGTNGSAKASLYHETNSLITYNE